MSTIFFLGVLATLRLGGKAFNDDRHQNEKRLK